MSAQAMVRDPLLKAIVVQYWCLGQIEAIQTLCVRTQFKISWYESGHSGKASSMGPVIVQKLLV